MQESKRNIIIFILYLLILIDSIFISSILIFDKISAYSEVWEWIGGGNLRDWQTLIAGILALSAALITVHRMRINHEDLIERKRLATRHKLHGSLSNIADYCEECVIYLINNGNKPKINVNDINNLADHIEFLDNKYIIDKISNIIQIVQIQNSRLKEFEFKNDGISKLYKGELARQIVNIIELYFYISNLLLYAREGRLVTEMNIDSARNLLIFHKVNLQQIDDELYKMIEEIIKIEKNNDNKNINH